MAKDSDRIILVTGATGRQGGAALHHLRDAGFTVRALTRHPDSPKARALTGRATEVVRGDLDDEESIRGAMDGVYGVYSVQVSLEIGPEAEVREGTKLADAAKRSRISHLVYSSVGSADQNTGVPHFESKFRIEQHIRATGVPYTILRPVFFMENWLGMKNNVEEGKLMFPLSPETRLQMIAVDDIGAFVTMAFQHPGKWQGRAVELAGDELSMTQIAEALGRAARRDVRYVQIPWDQFEQHAGHEMTVMCRWFEDVGYHANIGELRQERPGLMTFERWLHSNWQPSVSRAGA